MKKKSLLMGVVCIVLTAMNALTIKAQNSVEVEKPPTSTLPVTSVSESTDGKYNFKNFEVIAGEAGEYYAEFWILPAKYPNNQYSKFIVYVNENYIGTITPSVGNWQSVRVDENETVELSKGNNVITIATLSPEFPEVETIKVARYDSDASFSSGTYEDFLDEAISGASYDVIEGGNNMPLLASDATGVGLTHFSNVALNYTFYSTYRFTKDQEVFITSSSSAAHKIDVVYYGSDLRPTLNLGDLLNDSVRKEVIIDSLQIGKQTDLSILKPQRLYRPATSEEMQGLGWVFPSEKAKNSLMQVATARLTIPKTGLYLVRVRHADSGNMAVADVNVNGIYYYENAPISLSFVECEIPNDGNEYASMTCCNNFGTDDPFLFIHGANSDRIVGFNDDGANSN